ncbi:unnamed protein product [Leuciscus chuanchicus]
MAVDVGYWFKSSTKRKNKLDEFCVFCDTTYMETLLHVSTRWLSLEQVVTRILRLYAALRSYFGSCNEKQARCVRLRVLFDDPMTEIHLLFYQSTLIIFTNFNLLFQRQDPSVYLLHDQKLMSKFLKPGAFRTVDVVSVDIMNEENQLPDSQLGIGFTTRTTLNRLIEAGHVSPEAVKKFHMAARSFFIRSVEYALAKLPLNDQVLQYAKFVDFKQKTDVAVDYVQYFVQRFNHLLPYDELREQDHLNDEFLEYQMMEEKDIPDAIWRDAVVRESAHGEYHRMDRIWAYLSTVKNRISGSLQFPRLPVSSPDVSSADLGNLISQLAHEIGENIASQLQRSVGSAENQTTLTPSLNLGYGQSDLNMTGVKLVMKTDVKEPPYFRGDGTDKHTVHEWEEIMSVYLNKRGIHPQEYSQEKMSRLMGKARDIVKVTLRSTPSLQPAENPKLVFDILKQHFSEVTYSSMPLADFYNTLPLAGESPMDYWISLNKAVDVADECLRGPLSRSHNDAGETLSRPRSCKCPKV